MSIERVHKPTVNLLHKAGILSDSAAARAMLLAYYELSSRRKRPCTVSCARIAKDLEISAGSARYALLRWDAAKRVGNNGERRRAWKLSDSVTHCHAPQEEAEKPAPRQNSVTRCHALASRTVTPERDGLSRATTEIELEKRDREIARHALSSLELKEQSKQARIDALQRLRKSAVAVNTPESLRHAERYTRELAAMGAA